MAAGVTVLLLAPCQRAVWAQTDQRRRALLPAPQETGSAPGLQDWLDRRSGPVRLAAGIDAWCLTAQMQTSGANDTEVPFRRVIETSRNSPKTILGLSWQPRPSDFADWPT